MSIKGARQAYEAHARRHPVKAARLLVHLEAKAQLTDERTAGMIEGLRAGLDGSERCRRCGKALQRDDSRALGLGADCAVKVQACA